MEEAGRALLCAPYFSSVVLATTALLESGDDRVKGALLPDLAAGRSRASLAWVEGSGRWDEAGVTLPASRTADGWSLTGTKTFVPDGQTADHLIVAARTPRGVSLFLVHADAPGLLRVPQATMDPTRKQARLNFGGALARIIGEEGGDWPALRRALDIAAMHLPPNRSAVPASRRHMPPRKARSAR